MLILRDHDQQQFDLRLLPHEDIMEVSIEIEETRRRHEPRMTG